MKELDRDRIERLSAQMMMAILDNYVQGPISRDRVYEALSALAFAAAMTIHGCGDHEEPLRFFSQALNRSLQEANEMQIL